VTTPTDHPPCLAAACTRPQAHGILLCAPDADRLGQWIAGIADEYAQLSAVPSMQGREPGTGGAGGLASQRSVGDLTVMALRDRRSRERDDEDTDGNGARGVLEVLGSWASLIREERELELPERTVTHVFRSGVVWSMDVPEPATVLSERRLIATHLDWALTQPWINELHADIRQLWNLLQGRNNPQPYTARRQCACGGTIRWRDEAAECGSCGTRTTGLDVVRQQTEGAVA
jgi:hypothetical protein